MNMWQEQFWRENGKIDGNGGGWWTAWTIVVILLSVSCRLLCSRYRFFLGRIFPFSASTRKRDARSPPAPPSLRSPVIVSDLDLKNLIDNLDENSPGIISSVWENVVDRSNNLISYRAKCCKPEDGPLKYLSVTTFEECSVEVLVKFYVDNRYRMQWDKTVVHHEQLQVDQTSGTEVCRTIKKFPFLTPREYVLAWKLWQGTEGSFYCFSKECEHPLAPKEKRYKRVAVFRSGWRIRKVSGRNACEIKMVHQEDAGLNVEMAKLAFAKGIWSYVCKMDDALRKYSSRNQLQQNSAVGATLYIQKAPPGFEVTRNIISTVHPENSTAAVIDCLGACKSNTKKLTRHSSNKLIANGLVLLGGAICLSRGHSSLATKVAMAYVLTKLTKRGGPSEQANQQASFHTKKIRGL